MEIKFLKAGSGDSILIQHAGHNILVDGGNHSEYLLDQVIEIYKAGQVIDLLVITHHDDDHIKGIIDLLQKVVDGQFGDKTNFVKQVVFNSPRVVTDKLNNAENLLSYKQAYEVEELLIAMNQTWRICTEESEPINFDNLQLTFLSPSKSDVKEYGTKKGAYLSSDYKCDWSTKLDKLEKFVDDKSQDTSLYNRNSVVLDVQCDGKRILLTGDVTPDRLEQILKRMVSENGDQPIKFDYVKLPHHGSYRSLNKSIVESIDCENYIISTNSKRYFLPNKRAILKILKYSLSDSEKTFLFNYHEAMTNLNITSSELRDYKITLTPNNREYGISI